MACTLKMVQRIENPAVGVGGGGVGGTILIFSYIRRLWSFFGFITLNFIIFGVFRKMNIFWL